jgi:radical SAM superfamily enzyme YgiQ (UPF0313 family)
MPRRSDRGQSHGRYHREPIPKPNGMKPIRRRLCRYGVSPHLVRRRLAATPRPDAIILTSLMTYWYTGLAETIDVLNEVLPGVPMLLGGVYATLMPDHARALKCADVITGPGEGQVVEALQDLLGQSDGEHDPSLEFSPALDLLRDVRFLPLLTSRGCPFHCSYCASRVLSPHHVQQSPEAVEGEIQRAVDRYHVRDVTLFDDAFLVDPENHALPILDMIGSRFPGLALHSPNGLHAYALDRRVAGAMKSAGFQTIRLGFESAEDEFHRATGGKSSFAAFCDAVENLHSAGFRRSEIGAYLMVGLPGQSRDSIERDVRRAIEVGAYPRLAEYSPIPGTALWEQALAHARYPIDEDPIYHNCTLAPCAEPEVTPEYISLLRKKIAHECGRK